MTPEQLRMMERSMGMPMVAPGAGPNPIMADASMAPLDAAAAPAGPSPLDSAVSEAMGAVSALPGPSALPGAPLVGAPVDREPSWDPGIPEEDAVAPPSTLGVYTTPDGQQFEMDWGKIRRSTIASSRKLASAISEGLPEGDAQAKRLLTTAMPELIDSFGGNKAAAMDFFFQRMFNPAAERDKARSIARMRRRGGGGGGKGGPGFDMSLYRDQLKMAQRHLKEPGNDYGNLTKAYRMSMKGMADLQSNNGTRQWNAVKAMVLATEPGGRLSDYDVKMAEGLKSWLDQAKGTIEKGLSGTMSPEIRDQLLGAFASTLKISDRHLRGLRDQMLHRRDLSIDPAERRAWSTTIETAFKGYEWHGKPAKPKGPPPTAEAAIEAANIALEGL